MKGVVRTLCNKGDVPVAYDTDTGVIAEAEAIVANAIRLGHGVFDGPTQEQIKTRSATGDTVTTAKDVLKEHEEVLILPRMAGG
jgi:molybdopterin converting factor small subunit